MEHCQHDGQYRGLLSGREVAVGVVAHQGANQIDKRIEQAKHPNHAKHVEHQVGKGCTTSLRISTQGSQVGSGGGTDILTHHQGNTQIDGKHSRGTKQYGDGHHCRRTLHDASDERTDQEKDNDGKVALRIERAEEVDDRRVMLQVECLSRITQKNQREKEESDTEEEVTDVTPFLTINQHDAQKEGREHHDGQVDIVAERHNPSRERGADVGTHDDRDGLCQGEKTGVDERNRHHSGGRGTLHGAGNKCTREHTCEPIGGHRPENVSQLRSRHFLQSLAHHLHSVDEQRQRSENLKKYHKILTCTHKCFVK